MQEAAAAGGGATTAPPAAAPSSMELTEEDRIYIQIVRCNKNSFTPLELELAMKMSETAAPSTAPPSTSTAAPAAPPAGGDQDFLNSVLRSLPGI